LEETLGKWRRDGVSVVAIGLVGGEVVGALGLKDLLRPTAVPLVRSLLAWGKRVYIASGDSQGAVDCVVRELNQGLLLHGGDSRHGDDEEGVVKLDIVGVAGKVPPTPTGANPLTAATTFLCRKRVGGDDVIKLFEVENASGGLTPAGKVDLIARLQSDKFRVCMIGDGINDAAALARSELGVAMGAGSTSLTMECAHVVIRSDSLGDVRAFFRLAERVRIHILCNFVWAALYNCITMPLAAGVLYTVTESVVIPPGFSGLSELLSSVPVVLGSLLIYRFRK